VGVAAAPCTNTFMPLVIRATTASGDSGRRDTMTGLARLEACGNDPPFYAIKPPGTLDDRSGSPYF
jgi:hypothetical protein